MEKKKSGFFSKVKRWWNEELTESDRMTIKTLGFGCFEGAVFGSAITAVYKKRQVAKAREGLLVTGYIQGKLDAYKEIAENPYRQMDNGMKKLENQGKVKHF